MKIKADLIKCDDGIIILNYEGLSLDLEIEKAYSVELKPYKSKRSLESNRLMWAIIHAIANETQNDDWDIYVSGLEKCGQNAEYILGLPEIEKSLNQVYRVVKSLDEFREVNGKMLTVFKCYEGSSKYNTKQMADLINYFIDLAKIYNIKVERED